MPWSRHKHPRYTHDRRIDRQTNHADEPQNGPAARSERGRDEAYASYAAGATDRATTQMGRFQAHPRRSGVLSPPPGRQDPTYPTSARFPEHHQLRAPNQSNRRSVVATRLAYGARGLNHHRGSSRPRAFGMNASDPRSDPRARTLRAQFSCDRAHRIAQGPHKNAHFTFAIFSSHARDDVVGWGTLRRTLDSWLEPIGPAVPEADAA